MPAKPPSMEEEGEQGTPRKKEMRQAQRNSGSHTEQVTEERGLLLFLNLLKGHFGPFV